MHFQASESHLYYLEALLVLRQGENSALRGERGRCSATLVLSCPWGPSGGGGFSQDPGFGQGLGTDPRFRRLSHMGMKTNLFLVKTLVAQRSECRLWSLLLWRYSRPAWTRCCAVCCR